MATACPARSVSASSSVDATTDEQDEQLRRRQRGERPDAPPGASARAIPARAGGRAPRWRCAAPSRRSAVAMRSATRPDEHERRRVRRARAPARTSRSTRASRRPGESVPYSSACAPSAQTAAGTSRIGTRKAYPCAVTRNAEDILTDPPPPAADERLVYGPEPLQFGDLRDARRRRRARGRPARRRVEGDVQPHAPRRTSASRSASPASRRSTSSTGASAIPAAAGPARSRTSCSRSSTRGRSRRRLVLVGHSAGGHLALLAAGATGVPVVALAAVSDPPTWENDAVAAFFGGGPPPPEASPLAQAPARRAADPRARDGRRRRAVRAIGALRRRRPAARPSWSRSTEPATSSRSTRVSRKCAATRDAVRELLA